MSEERALKQPVFVHGAYKPFGEFTVAEVQGRADELRGAAGWGPTARVASVARSWSELARRMTEAGARQVRDLDRAEAEDFAHKLWVLPPGGSLL
jgi:hypothetical protein